MSEITLEEFCERSEELEEKISSLFKNEKITICISALEVSLLKGYSQLNLSKEELMNHFADLLNRIQKNINEES